MTAKKTELAHSPKTRRKQPPRPSGWDRLGRTTSLLQDVTFTAAVIGALKSVEVVVLSPSGSVFVVLVLAWFLTASLWIAAGGVGPLVVLGRIVQLFGPPRPSEPPGPKPQGEARVRQLGFKMVAHRARVGFLALIVMHDTRTGPFAWFAGSVLGWDAAVPFATVLVGPLAIAAPLVIVAVMPRQDRWPVVTAIQGSARPTPRCRRHPR